MGTRTLRTTGLLLAGALLAVTPAAADEWDNATDSDNGISTDNVLLHGSTQTHDLATQVGPVVDQDWFLMSMKPFSSYEVIVDSQTGDLVLGGHQVQRMDVNGNPAQDGDSSGTAVKVRWRTGAATQSVANYIRVSFPVCHTLCDLADRYQIRFYDTTYTVPRFNNSGSQTTALILQTTGDDACGILMAFFRADGSLIATRTTSLAGQSAVVLPASSIAGVEGQSGSIRILHDCGYQGLSGKAVSIEPSTGFTFDTPIVPRPH